MILDICQASLYSLLFGADGPPLASDEDFPAKLEILSKTFFDGCDKNQDGGAFEKKVIKHLTGVALKENMMMKCYHHILYA